MHRAADLKDLLRLGVMLFFASDLKIVRLGMGANGGPGNIVRCLRNYAESPGRAVRY